MHPEVHYSSFSRSRQYAK